MLLRITAELTAHMVKNHGVAQDADEATVRKAVSEALTSGKIEWDLVKSLAPDSPTGAELKVKALVAEATKPLEEKFDRLLAAINAKGGDGEQLAGKAVAVTPASAGAASTEGSAACLAQKGYAIAGVATQNGTVDAATGRIEVKSILDQFNDTRTAATWDKSSNPLLQKAFGGRPITEHYSGDGVQSIDMPTDRSKAISGAWLKHAANRYCKRSGKAPAFHMTELDRKLIEATINECKFIGPIGWYGDGKRDSEGANHWCEGMKLTDIQRKAVLDDSTSGGLEAVPIEFDANYILTPLLNGELFPLVNTVQVTRRRIEGVKIGNWTMSWGVGSGTSIGLFDTDALISAFDNNIYPISGAIEIGRDFVADSPIDVGGVLLQTGGQSFLKEMDNAIADGNGTDRPTGIFTTAGVSTFTPAGGAAAAPQIGDYESMYFNIAKEFRTEPGARFIYVSTDTSYKRARGIPVDSSADQRRVFGMDQANYQVFGHPYRVNGSISNAEQAGVMINRYRLYRRAGLEVQVVTEDATLARQNKQLLIIRARFGGGMDHSSAMVKTTQGQA